MKKILLSSILLAFILAISYAQNSSTDVFLSKHSHTINRLIEIANGATVLDNFQVCEESFAWDTLNGEFVYDGESFFTYEEIGNLKKFTAESVVPDEEGVTKIRIETYASFQVIDDVFFAVGGDSILIYLADENDNYELFSRQINHFEDELLVFTEEYFDFSAFGLPIGMVKAGEVFYHYDANDFLIVKVSDQLDFNTFQMEFSDSITYENNNLGLATVETGYQADFISGEVKAYYLSEYTYVNQYYIDVETTSSYVNDAWDKSNRYTFSYDDDNRRTGFLQEKTIDNGMNWQLANRQQNIYENDLPINIPDRELVQDYINGAWRNNALRLYEECTSNLEAPDKLDFRVWFNDDALRIESESKGTAIVQLYDLGGRMLYSESFNSLPDRIIGLALNRGIYAIKITLDGQENVKKVFK